MKTYTFHVSLPGHSQRVQKILEKARFTGIEILEIEHSMDSVILTVEMSEEDLSKAKVTVGMAILMELQDYTMTDMIDEIMSGEEPINLDFTTLRVTHNEIHKDTSPFFPHPNKLSALPAPIDHTFQVLFRYEDGEKHEDLSPNILEAAAVNMSHPDVKYISTQSEDTSENLPTMTFQVKSQHPTFAEVALHKHIIGILREWNEYQPDHKASYLIIKGE